MSQTLREPPVIAIDGPSGSGKGTVAARLSEALGFHLLDSGALYRLIALVAERDGVALDDAPALARIAAALDVQFRVSWASDPPVRTLLAGEEVDAALRTERCADHASRVAAVPALREALLVCQRGFRRPPGLVADGRDMGTVVFPRAELKVYLTASPEVRARRRHKQLIAKGISVSLLDLLKEIEARDRRDTARCVSPLRPAEDAIVLDTGGLGTDEVFNRVAGLAATRRLTDGSHER